MVSIVSDSHKMPVSTTRYVTHSEPQQAVLSKKKAVVIGEKPSTLTPAILSIGKFSPSIGRR